MSGSEASDFFSQIGGLIAITCAAGMLWLVLMVLVMQRASERRHRRDQGLEPLPGIWAQVLAWFKQDAKPAPAAVTESARPARVTPVQATPARTAPRAAPLDIPAPDLNMLTGELEQDVAPDDASDDEAYDLAAPSLDAMLDTAPDDDADLATDDAPEDAATVGTEEAGDYGDVASGEEPPDSVELLRVWRDLSDGQLIVEIGGKRFGSLGELRGANLERRFVSVVRDLDSMAEQPPTPRQPARAPTRREPPRRESAPHEDPPLPVDDELTGQPLSMSPGSMFRQMTRVAMGHGAPPPTEEKPERSIADQIEDLLQERLAGSPEFSARTIHVKPSLEGGVRIEVDGAFYDGVGEVADDDVRALIQDVVREWEESQ